MLNDSAVSMIVTYGPIHNLNNIDQISRQYLEQSSTSIMKSIQCTEIFLNKTYIVDNHLIIPLIFLSMKMHSLCISVINKSIQINATNLKLNSGPG